MDRQSSCFNKWMYNRERKKYISDYLIKSGIKTVGIYGYGDLAKHFLYETNSSSLNIEWIIDKKDVDLYKIEQLPELKDVDIVIIMSIEYADDMEISLIKNRADKKFIVMTIEELVSCVYSWGN